MRVGLPSHAAPERGGAHWKNKQTRTLICFLFLPSLVKSHSGSVFPPNCLVGMGSLSREKTLTIYWLAEILLSVCGRCGYIYPTYADGKVE